MHVACNIDRNYVKYCAVMLTSLLENNRRHPIHVHVISSPLEPNDEDVLRSIVEDKYGKKISFHFPPSTILEDCRTDETSHISLATYYRLFLTSILPPEVRKVIYLDCDLIVNGDISEFWNMDISDVSLGCVEDMWSQRPGNYVRLHYDRKYSYFNVGVLLINLERLRTNGFEQRAKTYLKEHVGELEFYDQDLLNALLHDDKKYAALRWNVQDGFLRWRRAARMSPEGVAALELELRTPVIIHYTGSKKPWHYKSQHPWKHLYFRYLDMTQWRGERPVTPIGYRLNLALNRALQACGLKKSKYVRVQEL